MDGEVNWQEKCRHLEHQLSVLKEVSTMRKSLIELRESESKALIVKLRLLEEAVSEEKKYRIGVMKRLELAELECIQLKQNLNRSLETLDQLKIYHEAQLRGLVNNLEACELKCKQQGAELEDTMQKNCRIEGKLDETQQKLHQNNKTIKSLESKLKQSTDRNVFLTSQVALIHELIQSSNNVESLPIDMERIKTIIRQSEDVSDNEASETSTSDVDEGVDLSLIDDASPNKDSHDDEGEDSCYKTVDTKNGPQTVLSVSRTFIKLKDLILEKQSLQKEIDNLKNLNTKLESKVDRQEHRLYVVTKELNKTWSFVTVLKQQQNKLHNSEALLKYELKEKRVLLERLKKELLSVRDKWRRVREKNSESQCVWQQLKDEFAQRREQSEAELSPDSQESANSDDNANSNKETSPIPNNKSNDSGSNPD